MYMGLLNKQNKCYSVGIVSGVMAGLTCWTVTCKQIRKKKTHESRSNITTEFLLIALIVNCCIALLSIHRKIITWDGMDFRALRASVDKKIRSPETHKLQMSSMASISICCMTKRKRQSKLEQYICFSTIIHPIWFVFGLLLVLDHHLPLCRRLVHR